MIERYKVFYSEHVREHLRKMAATAKANGQGALFLAALRQLDERLHVYPQFGEPLTDLVLQPAQLWIGSVPPLVVQYFLDEAHRTVIVGRPIQALPRSGLD